MELQDDILNLFNLIYSKKTEEIAQLKDEIAELNKKLGAAQKQEKAWANLLDYNKKDWPLHFLKQFQNLKAEVQAFGNEDKNILKEIDELPANFENDIKRTFTRFPELFEKACNEAKIAIDMDSSRHPKYTFEKGFITLIISEAKKSAKISDYEGALAKLPADIPAIIEVIKNEHKRLFQRKFDGKEFLERLRKQYLEIIKKENKTDGASIPIRHITTRMREKIKGFRTDEFLVDLSKFALSKDENLEIERRKLDLQQTKSTSQGMLLYGASERGYIGFVVFKEK